MKEKNNNEEILKEKVVGDTMDVESTETEIDDNDDSIEIEVTPIKEEAEELEELEATKAEASETATVEESEEIDDMTKIATLLVKTEAELKESQDRYARTMAEFDNFRKRTYKEKTEMHERGAKEVLEKLLPIVDNFERAIDHISDAEKDLAITQGVEMIYKQLMGALAEIGIEEIEALNQEFDPNLHNAVSHEDNEDYDDNMVQDVFQKGYMYKDLVLRHSMVKVVN